MVGPPVIAFILSTVNREAQAYNSFARTLAVAMRGICEAASAWPVAAEMDSVSTLHDLDDALKPAPHAHDPKVIQLRNVVEFRFNV